MIRRLARALGFTLLACAMLALPLMIPPGDPVVPIAPASGRAFIWGRDSLWRALEARFVAARAAGCGDSLALRSSIDGLRRAADSMGGPRRASLPTEVRIDGGYEVPGSRIHLNYESQFVEAASRVAACPSEVGRFAEAQFAWRAGVKRESRNWDPDAPAARDQLYRALYGGRAALEEVLLQQPGAAPALLVSPAVPASPPPPAVGPRTSPPTAAHSGVVLHSGDLLVSRGGYPTSALIARGNDYPGNFSHVALVHIDSGTHAITVIEAHIEKGVAITTAEGYLADKKLRVLVLRPRADLPALVADPMLPHKAATAMLERARREHIPYDFQMDYADGAKLFCSEVASWGYRQKGLGLWMGKSTISNPGLRQWLASFGVTHFETQEPSDLEYDPQLEVVAEWRDPATLFEDHVDNAVTDAMLEGAERGDRLGYSTMELPLARLAKAWSWTKERFGGIGPVPEGMSAAAALRNRGYGARHDAYAERVMARANEWSREHGYRPPYWVLVSLARGVVRGIGADRLSPPPPQP